jgi:hypothetical protein
METLDLLDERVGAWFGELGLPEAHRPGGVSFIDAGGHLVAVAPFDSGGHPWLRLVAVLLTCVRPSLALITRVHELNAALVLGAVHLFEDGTLALSATLPAARLETDDFQAALQRLGADAVALAPELEAAAQAAEEGPCS